MPLLIEELCEIARIEAGRFRHKYVRNEHLLLALLKHQGSFLTVDYADVEERVAEMPCPTCAAEEKLELSAAAQRALDYAESLAENRNPTAQDILSGIVHFSPLSRRILRDLNVDIERIKG